MKEKWNYEEGKKLIKKEMKQRKVEKRKKNYGQLRKSSKKRESWN
jgi:hypothetical protein